MHHRRESSSLLELNRANQGPTPGTDKETYCTTEERGVVSLNTTETTKDTAWNTDKESYCTTEVRAAITSSLTDPTMDTTSVTDKETHRLTVALN